jgi:hypothetical protein
MAHPNNDTIGLKKVLTPVISTREILFMTLLCNNHQEPSRQLAGQEPNKHEYLDTKSEMIVGQLLVMNFYFYFLCVSN